MCQAKQSEMSADAFGKLIVNFSHKEARFDSRTEPLVRMFRLLPICIESLRELTVSGDDDDRRYCMKLLRSFGGATGYDSLVSSAAVGDGMVVVGKYLNLSQVADDDSALEGDESARMVHEVKVLFEDGGIWLPEAKGTLTHCVLEGIKGKAVFHGNPDGKEEVIFLGWPAPGSLERVKPIERTKRFAELIQAFHASHFPNFEVGKLWMAFNLRSRLTIGERSAMVERLCMREGKDFHAVQRALFGVNGDTFSGGSVWNRATYYSSGGGLQVRRDTDTAADVGARFPSRPVTGKKKKTRRLRIPLPGAGNVAAWICVLEDLDRIERSDRYKDLVFLLERYVARLSSTGSIERWFGQLALTELKQRARKLGPNVLEVSMKLRLQDLGGVRRGNASFNPRSLLVVSSSVKFNSIGGKIDWPATIYAKECQKLYAEFFGTRASESRSLTIQEAGQVRGTGERKRKLCIGASAGNKSINAFKQEHSNAVRRAVAAREAGKSEGVLGDVSWLDADTLAGKDVKETEKEEKQEEKEEEKEKEKEDKKKDKKDKEKEKKDREEK